MSESRTTAAATLTSWLACWLVAGCFVLAAAQASPRKQDSLSYNQDRLIRNLFRHYEKSVVAQLRSRSAVVVSIAFTLTQINNLDEKTQVLTTTAWMEVLWSDERLMWDPNDYNGTKSIVIPPELMWLPDIGLQNSANEIYHSSLVDKKFKVTLYSNGNVLWTPGGKFYTNCELNIDYFPFDDQRCVLHFTNWAYNGNEMNLTVTYDVVKLDNYQLNGEWDIMSTNAHRVDKYYACCGDVPYPSVYFTIHLRRKYLYYVMNVIAPCIMLSVLVTLVFYLPSGTGEKISLGVTIFLAFIIFLLMVAESIPQNSDSVPILSVYLATFLALTTSSLFTSVVVLHIHHLSPDKKLPSWLRRLVFGFLARALCMRSIHARYGPLAAASATGVLWRQQLSTYSALPLLSAAAKSSGGGGSSCGAHDEGLAALHNHRGQAKCRGATTAAAASAAAPPSSGRWCSGGYNDHPPSGADNTDSCCCGGGGGGGCPVSAREYDQRPVKERSSCTGSPRCHAAPAAGCDGHGAAAAEASGTRSLLAEVLEQVKAIARERLSKEGQEAARDEWQAVAKVIDRLLLFGYIIFIIVATAIILVAQPLLSQS